MPHVIVKMYPGRTEEQKQKLAQQFKDALIEIINCDPKHISVDIVEVAPENWSEVEKNEIFPKWDRLYIKPYIKPE